MERPVHGDPLHTRSLSYSVYAAPNGGVRAHGDIIDLRKSGFIPMGRDFQAAGIIHKMEIDLELDAERVVRSLAIDQPAVAIEPSSASNGECCRDPAPALQALVGERMDSGFIKRLSEVAGGPRGCSHILTLFQLMASGIPHSLDHEASERAADGAVREDGERIANRSLYADGFDGGDHITVWVRSSDVDTTPLCAMERSFERLARHREHRIVAAVDARSFTLRSVTAEERERSHSDFASAEWRTLDDQVEGLAGLPLMGGLARELFARFGQRPESTLLLDGLLNLAPAYIQIVAALSDRMVTSPSGDSNTSRSESSSLMGLGGREDACYMWRRDSPLLQIRKSQLGQ